jgi:AhpD family alkylhydroperoxidase
MARLEPARPHGLDPIRRYTYRAAKRMYRTPTEPVTTLAHHRPSLVAYGVAGLMIERYSSAIDPKLRHLAMLRTSQLIGCEWCLDFGSMLAQKSGIPEDTLRELSTWRTSDRFDDVDRVVLEYAEAMTRTPVDVSDELFARLREHFDERQLVELTMAIALENMFGRTNWALGIHGEGFSEGMYCVRPDTEAARALVAG